MFTITCNDGDRHWSEEQDISLDIAIARLRKLGRGRHWLYVSSYGVSDAESQRLEWVLSIAIAPRKRYHLIFNDHRLASRGQWRAIDPSLQGMTGTVLVHTSGGNSRRPVYEVIEIDEVENALSQFFTEKQMSDTQKTVWQTTR